MVGLVIEPIDCCAVPARQQLTVGVNHDLDARVPNLITDNARLSPC